jgi:protein involved in polysaccharide export with SLBB domain
MTVKDAVAAVGGFTPAAESASITLRRAGAEALASIDGAKAVADDLVQNAILSPGDVLVVAAKKTAEAPSPTPPAPDQAGTVQQAAVSVAVPVEAPPVDEDVPVLVEGAVERPGMYIYSRMPLRQVFEQVGGLKKEADRGKIVIYRGSAADPASAKQIKYDLGKIEKGKAEDIELEPGDVIQVPMKKKGLWDRIGDTFRKMGTRSLLGGIPLVGPVIGSLSGG